MNKVNERMKDMKGKVELTNAIVYGDVIQFVSPDHKEINKKMKVIYQDGMEIKSGFAVLDQDGDVLCDHLFEESDDAYDFLNEMQ